nr:unnamed protein product [Callosobruchus analis]
MEEEDTEIDFRPITKEQKPPIPTAKPNILQQGRECQRLGTTAFNNIRYAERHVLFFFVLSSDLQSPEIIDRKRPLEPTPDLGDLQPRAKRKRVESPGETTAGATVGVAAPQEVTNRTRRVAAVVRPINDYSIPSSFLGGRLSGYLPNWIEMGVPNYILHILKGYTLPLVNLGPRPSQNIHPSREERVYMPGNMQTIKNPSLELDRGEKAAGDAQLCLHGNSAGETAEQKPTTSKLAASRRETQENISNTGNYQNGLFISDSVAEFYVDDNKQTQMEVIIGLNSIK